ncbi:MAG TPA: DNA polymerase I [Bacteroidetes bacterium]|nr:DNA polymerase I [Bacteroidota bacterium]
MSKHKLFILDAYALIFRAYYAFIKNPRYNSKGLNTSAIFGFVNVLDEILKKEKPTHIAVCFDAPAATFRKEIYPEYKANREATPEDIKKSIPYIKEILDGFNITVLEQAGFEADDLAGSLAKKFSNENFEIFLMTSDKDYLQLIDENIKIYKPRKSNTDIEIIDVEAFQNNYGLNSPEQYIDVLALAGDTADNIPGIPGIGEKTALKLLQEFKSIEGIYQNISKLKGKQKEKIEQNIEAVELSKKLVVIKTDIELDISAEDLKIEDFKEQKLKDIFAELDFRNTAERILQKPKPVQQTLFDNFFETQPKTKANFLTIKDIKPNYTLVETEYEIEELVKHLENSKEFAFDTETSSINPHEAELVGLSFCIEINKAYYVPIPKNRADALETLKPFKSVLENTSIAKIGQNLKYDLIVVMNYDIKVRGKLFDTMVAHHLLAPDLKDNMDYLAETYLNYKTIHIEELIGQKGKTQRSMSTVPIDKIKDYAAEDADITLQLKHYFAEKLEKEGLKNLFENIEMPLVYVLAEMEHNGVLIDHEFLKKYREELVEKTLETERKIYEISGSQFNISSPKQLGEILFQKIKISDKPKLTKTKQYATDENELLKYKDKHPIVKTILEYRSLKKLITTYVDALPQLINPKTGRIHTSYNQTVTITGRLSSNNPNLQNIPIKTAEGREIRKAFIPNEGCILVDADYSQVELRIMAHLSQDPTMLEAFQNNLDIHAQTAAKIFKVELENVTSEMRHQAKTANFAMIYGSSSFGLSQNLNIPVTEAKTLIDNYFATYPKVKEYMDKMIKHARDSQFVTTLMGRKRYLKDINSQNSLVRSNAEHNAINTPIQGSAADVIKLAMIKIANKIEKLGLKTKMIMQVHDELTFEVPLDEKDQMMELVRNEMENAVQISVPLIVDIQSGMNWAEAH